MIVVIGKRGFDKLSPDVRPVFLKAVAEATAYQRAHAAEKGQAAMEELKKLGVTYQPMVKAEREFVRKEMATQLWTSFALQYPATKPLFEAISTARA